MNPTAATIDVSVVIPTRNGGARLLRVFDALLGQVTSLRREVLIIDSESSDGSREAARARGFRVLETRARDFNHGATRDQAIAQARGRAVALLVQDALPLGDGWLQELAAPLLYDEEAAGAFSRQVPIPGGNPILAERLEGWVAGQGVERRCRLEDAAHWERLTPIDRLQIAAFDNVSSCVRRSAWMAHPFGKQPFGEDLTWSTWALKAGYAIRFHPRSVVEHSHDRSAWHETRRIYSDHRNLNRLFGLVTVPDLAAALRARGPALQHYRAILQKAGLTPKEHRQRQRWVQLYAWGEVLAQWLAPRVNRSEHRLLVRWLDHRLRRGI